MVPFRLPWSRRCPESQRPPAAAAAVTAAAVAAAPMTGVETLEARQLFASGPAVIGEALIGPPTAVNAVVVTFNESLDPATAQDVNAYEFGRPVSAPSSDSGGGILGGFLPFARPANTASAVTPALATKARGVRVGKVRIASAVYDDATHSVTLTPTFPFRGDRFFRVLRVFGTGADAVKDAAGNALDGNADGQPGGNAVLRFTVHKTKRLSYADASGNRVTLNLQGPGQIWALLRHGADPSPIVFLYKTQAARSVLTGTVAGGGNGGTTQIQEISGTGSAQADGVLSNPAFQVGLTLA